MQTYVIICKLMGQWPTQKALQTWIRYHWKPKGSIDLHLGSKGFFTVVFTNIEDKERVFEGGPYFYVATGLYMRPWKMNFVPERENFTSVPVWVRIYSLPLDYWQIESLAAIGNKLGRFVKATEATRRGKYTSFVRICVEMDLSGALPNEVILETIFKTFHKGKNGKKGPKQHEVGGQKASQNQFQVLEEEEDIVGEDQVMKEGYDTREKEEYNEQTQENEKQKGKMMSDSELEMDQEMNQSEMETEDNELQEILDRENLHLEGFLHHGTTSGVE
eukprot:PITA_29313